ncbi:MAG: hypothetical protein ACT4NY_16270 [Pseudonocardiales bacterium]
MRNQQSGRDEKTCAVCVPFVYEVSEMAQPAPDLIVADLAQLVTPGLRSPRADLVVLPHLAAVQHELAGGASSQADAIEKVVNRGLLAMAADTYENPTNRLADPVKALRAVLALRPGAERIKSKTRRLAAAQALGLLSGDGWRAHHEKALLLDLAKAIHALEVGSLTAEENARSVVEGNINIGGPGIAKFYPDFVDIGGDWESLFTSSSTLDLAIMYGATWRNTFRKHLYAIAGRPDGRIRVVLPDPSAGSILIELYAQTLEITSVDLRERVQAAIVDFRAMEPCRHVEIYVTATVFRHAIYMFADRAILALYSLCGERIPTPAMLVSKGGLLSFVRLDFDRLIERSERIS